MQFSYLLLKSAVTYVNLYKRKTFVIKMGGEMLVSESIDALVSDIAMLVHLGIRVVLVHGGGPQATSLARRLGHEPTFVGGRRVTKDEDLEIAKLVYAGKLNLDLLASMNRNEIQGVGVSGIDASFIVAKRRPASSVEGGAESVDWGHVGDIEKVDPAILDHLLEGGYVPVVSALCTSADGEPLNVNADSIAANIAATMKAEKLILITSAPGLLADPDDDTSTISFVSPSKIAELRASGAIVRGMLPKTSACVHAVEGGVRRTHIIDGRRPNALLEEIFTNEGCGTMVLSEEDSRDYLTTEQASDDD